MKNQDFKTYYNFISKKNIYDKYLTELDIISTREIVNKN